MRMRALSFALALLICGAAGAQTSSPIGQQIPIPLPESFTNSGRINVKDAAYGASGGGSVNDSTAVNNAVAAACAASPHKSVFFPNGTYLLDSTKITVTCDTIRLYGEGASIIKVGASNTEATTTLIGINNRQGGPIVVENLILDGGANTVCSAQPRVLATASSSWYVTFRNVTAQNTCRVALQFTGDTKYSGVRDSYFKNISLYWLSTGLSTDARVGVSFVGTTTTGWVATKAGGAYGNFFVNNTMDTFGFDGVQGIYQADWHVEGNTFRPGVGNQPFVGNVGEACVFGYADWAPIIANNICEYTSGNGFDTAGNGSMLVADNIIIGSGKHGIGVSSGRLYGVLGGEVGTVVVGNHVYNSGRLGSGSGIGFFQATGGSGDENIDGSLVANNYLVDDQGSPTQQYGIAVGDGAPSISRVVIGDNAYNGNVLGNYDSTMAAYAALSLASMILSPNGSAAQTINSRTADFQVLDTGANAAALVARWSNDANSPAVQCAKSRGTTIGSFTTVQASDVLCQITGFGSDGAAFDIAAQIVMSAIAPISSGIVPGQIDFKAANSAGSLITPLSLTAAGATVTGTLSVSGHDTLEGVTSTGATGTGKHVYDGSPQFSAGIGLGAAANTGNSIYVAESACPTTSAGQGFLCESSSVHRWRMAFNGGTAVSIVGDSTSDTFTNKTYNTAGTGNAFSINGTAVSTLVPVAVGGTNLASGTSGGILGYTASGTLASSAALAANALVIGGGAGATPTTTTTAAGILTWLGVPSSANLASAVTDEVGSGPLEFAQRTISAKTGNYSVSASTDIGKHFDNIGAAGAVTFTLPAAAAGLQYCFAVIASQDVKVAPTTSDVIYMGTTASTNGTGGGYLDLASSKGANICVVAHEAGEYLVTSSVGTITVH